YRSYERHFSQITQKTIELLQAVKNVLPAHSGAEIVISGSAGMGLAQSCDIPFVQEVYATRIATNRLVPGTDVVIELGGEDAKILFLSGGMEVRMNGSCAGGTGAFIDQMATLLSVSLDEMNELAAQHEKLYTIASRCGVFAKSDIQPLLNQGAKKTDVSASIFGAVVNQTISGLAQGRPIKGNILYLGGPLTFLSHLRKSFDETLKTTGICPADSLYFVSLGAAFSADREIDIDAAIDKLTHFEAEQQYATMTPLFRSKEEYDRFHSRHAQHDVPRADPSAYHGRAYLGIDAGSTTVKTVVLAEDGQMLTSSYRPNSGNPVPLIRSFLLEFYKNYPDIEIAGSTVTGYGEEIVKNAFCIDHGIVETVAHFTAAKDFLPAVEFIIDIGGQDIKCFKIRNGTIDNIFLNEACSSGCGSFLQTFANALGYSIEEFARLGLFGNRPVDLGSRCTVFMNSSVKQAQKDGASIENISAGLSISVVKNALYKVIRATSAQELGRHIVVQGGTFLNDAVLRAFEQELDVEVVRPTIAGLMGAYGAALYAQAHSAEKSSILTLENLADFTHDVRTVNCGLCENNCQLTINTFDGGRRLISGNRCERPVTKKAADNSLNIYDYKVKLLQEYKPIPASRGRIGIPMGLNMFELLPFWQAFFTTLGFEVVTSPPSNRELYLLGQDTIPSDTVCFPAKLLHGHVQQLIEDGVDTIFYPCLTYNVDEGLGDNHYNCPVVAYYPEVLSANMSDIKQVTFIKDYVGIHRRRDFPKKMFAVLSRYFDGITQKEVSAATRNAYDEYFRFFERVRRQGQLIVERARKEHRPIIVLAGRPYHVDPEINHGIDRLIAGFGVAIISEDCVSCDVKRFKTTVLNQWTYHSRLYAAAKYIADKPDMNLVQLVSFGCGVDAITTDEVRDILEKEGRIYTQIKIDEITNLGAVRIRLRSLFAATQEQ
ncbi:MAG: acyl-CoA dehydratase activase-related protein, partial [Acetanaerobacterium sp.]